MCYADQSDHPFTGCSLYFRQEILEEYQESLWSFSINFQEYLINQFYKISDHKI